MRIDENIRGEFRKKDSCPYLEIYESTETEMDKLNRKDRLPMLWKRDPVIAREFGKG